MWLRSGQPRLRAIPPGRHLPLAPLHSTPLHSTPLSALAPFSLCGALKLIWNKIKFTLAASRRDRVTQMKLLKLAKWPSGQLANWAMFFLVYAARTTHERTTLTHSAVSVAKISLFRLRGTLCTLGARDRMLRRSSWAEAIHHLSDYQIWDSAAPWLASISSYCECSGRHSQRG